MSAPLRFAVIGSPVAHSKSPAMHLAAFRALGLPHAYEKINTSVAELPARVAALRASVFAGLNVTVPHKIEVLALVDEIDASARATGAANTLVHVSAGVRAYNTDAPALVAELRALSVGVGAGAGVRVGVGAGAETTTFAGRSAVVLGTGGAARAAIFALGQLGVSRVVVRSRRERPELSDVLAGTAATLSFEPLEAPRSEAADLIAIVQATTAGMAGGSAPGELVADAIAWASVPPACVVYDVVYTPLRTPLLERAAHHRLANEGGLGMLARQGALAFELWLGVAPPLDVMRAALSAPV